MTTTVCLLAAVASMVLYGLASVSQAAATRHASGAKVMVHPLYVLGLVADGLAWAASVAALARLPLVVVQPLLAGSVAVAVLLAVPVLGARLRRVDVAGVALTTVGLVAVALAAGDESDVAAPSWITAALLAVLAVTGVAAWVTYRRGPAAMVALVAGVAFAGAALAGRVVAGAADLSTWGGALSLLRDPLTWALVGFGVLGTLAYARALERGGLGLATAVMWVVEAVLPAAVGVAVLGDGVRPGWAAAAVGGLLLAVAGCVVLALSPTQAVLSE